MCLIFTMNWFQDKLGKSFFQLYKYYQFLFLSYIDKSLATDKNEGENFLSQNKRFGKRCDTQTLVCIYLLFFSG